ncbi:hypothetical protein O181_017462 [Austropuccinia psidii MF-1]|uniref:Uncharacterized protein n=1 Tax=Austropuccinia psidii MF-1 TaxID=1389203 RepID=A0A9Q3GSL0_9BASI|nr:hypothetical protein [Austropuccinia psidii MF-1]
MISKISSSSSSCSSLVLISLENNQNSNSSSKRRKISNDTPMNNQNQIKVVDKPLKRSKLDSEKSIRSPHNQHSKRLPSNASKFEFINHLPIKSLIKYLVHHQEFNPILIDPFEFYNQFALLNSKSSKKRYDHYSDFLNLNPSKSDHQNQNQHDQDQIKTENFDLLLIKLVKNHHQNHQNHFFHSWKPFTNSNQSIITQPCIHQPLSNPNPQSNHQDDRSLNQNELEDYIISNFIYSIKTRGNALRPLHQ